MSEEVKKVENVEEGTVVELEAETTEESTTENETVEAEAVEESTEAESSEESEEELEQYSDRVQKRIATLTRRLREAERASESAYSYATQLQQENNNLTEKVKGSDVSLVAESESRLKSQKAQVQTALKEAYKNEDYDKVAEAQDVLASIAVEMSKVKSFKERIDSEKENVEQVPQETVKPSAQAPLPVPEPKAEAWAEKNEWFGSDRDMTQAAAQIHEDLVYKGFDTSSDEYYTEIDKRIRAKFPTSFPNEGSSKKPTQRVASAGRADTSAKPGKKQVKLSPSEVQMAKKLNVPLNEYAKFVKR
jgi:DNA repair exonuclease SbcCD ATPase subunit